MSGWMTSGADILGETRWTGDESLPVYLVPGWQERLGLVAGITGRGTEGDFDLGWHGPGPVARFSVNWRKLVTALGQGSPLEVVQGYQTHGTTVRWHEPLGDACWLRVDETDGHACDAAGVMLTVTVADCVPVYLALPDGPFALVHAGWRGASSHILAAAVEKMVERSGRSASEIVMHCGVAICGNCYEVGHEVLEAFGLRGDFPGPWGVDLRRTLADQAEQLGLEDVTLSDRCTSCEPGAFYSHRGEQGKAGRMVAFLGRPAAAAGPASY